MKASTTESPENDDYWLIDETPQGIEEEWHFEHPSALTSAKDTRDALENKDYQNDIEGKGSFRRFATSLGGWWAFMLIALVFAQGSDWVPYHLETSEFITVITTTTTSIFGVVFVVGRYLYGSKAYESKTNAENSVAKK